MLTGFAAAGTPTGAQLTGRHDNDRVLCVIADALLARLGPPGRAWSPDRLAEHWPWTAPARRG